MKQRRVPWLYFLSLGIWMAASGSGLASRAVAATAILVPSKDNTIYGSGDANLSSGAGANLFVGRSGQGRTMRSLIAFNVSSAIPAGSTITSVSLSFAINTPRSNSSTVRVHRVQADWGEGTSVSNGPPPGSGGADGAAATIGDATWNARFFNTAFWANPGGDFAVEASASQPVSGTSGTVVFTSAGLMAEVQSWLDTPAANFGWILLAQNETAAAVRFSAREGASPPSLQVSYTPSVPRHAADCAPADGQISQSELLRVIEIYNVRHGTIRTGRYAVATAVTVDGFAFDPATANNEVVTLMRYHSADTNRDGKLALFELARVIELYQARVGGTRTGEYRVEADTEDGFAPGP